MDQYIVYRGASSVCLITGCNDGANFVMRSLLLLAAFWIAPLNDLDALTTASKQLLIIIS
jgi:hypothetical protein